MTRHLTLISAGGLCMFVVALAHGDDKDAKLNDEAGIAFFEKSIRPVLVEQCFPCHHAPGPASSYEAGFLLDSLEGLLRGGDSGAPAIVPGDPEKSPLIKAIRYAYADKQVKGNMPPKWGKDRALGGKLSDATVKNFEAWVKRGAPVPENFMKPAKFE